MSWKRPGIVVLALSLLILNLLLAACGDTATPAPAVATAASAPNLGDFGGNSSAAGAATAGASAAPATTKAVQVQPTPVPVQGTVAPAVSDGKVPRLEAASCPFQLAKKQAESKSVTCGYLVVPQSHRQPDGKTLRLAVAILKSTADKPADQPLIYLQGGPGGQVETTIAAFSSDKFFDKEWLKSRDVIIFDQRGVGYSQPTLDCREYNEATLSDLIQGVAGKVQRSHEVEALDLCLQRLTAAGNNLEAFNTAENAADVNDLREALGYKQVDLYGVSYGTRLAQTVMRDFPQSVRSVILDSSYPLQADIFAEVPVSFDRSLNLLFQACAASPECNKNYPNLKATFSKAIAKLNAKPAAIKVQHPRNFQLYDVKVTAREFLNILFNLFYVSDYIRYLPALIWYVSQEEYIVLSELSTYGIFRDDDTSQGMYYSVMCSEEAAFSSPEAVGVAARSLMPEIRDIFAVDEQNIYPVCQKWPVKKAAKVENEPVKSNIPTLVLAGEFDPITPPNGAQVVTSGLSRSFYFEFSAVGHGVVPSNQCAARISQAFLQNPTSKPGSSCITKTLPNFVVF